MSRIDDDVYAIKKGIADKYLSQFDIDWDSLPDINSLHDVENEEEIHDLCRERLREEGFPFEDLP